MNLLGIEGGGTRTTALLLGAEGGELATVTAGPGNVRLLNGEELHALLISIRDRLPEQPGRIGAGMAGVRTAADRERLTRAIAEVWPGVPSAVGDDLLVALEAEDWKEGCAAQVLLLSGTGSCCFGRRKDGASVKVGGRGHIIGDRGSACDIAMHALKSTVTIYDIDAAWPALGADMLAELQMNDPESLIEWSMTAGKSEIASLAKVVFEAAVSRRDEIATAILRRAAERLSKDAVHCAARIAAPEEKVQIVLNGSTLLKNPWFVEDVIARIREARPGCEVAPLSRSGAWGATRLALRAEDRGSAGSAAARPKPAPGAFRPVSAAPTEGRNPRSVRLSEMPVAEAIRLMLDEDAGLPAKILTESANIEWTVEAVARAFGAGGRLIYCGAGTSGRLGVLDASECPPTFRTSSRLVQGVMAGGKRALWSAVEGAEDDEAAGTQAMTARAVDARDVVIGISASGHAPFIWGCLGEARRRGATTVLLCCNPGYRGHPLVDRAILPDTGPEVLTGSTRLKAGTATKLVLNIITTLAMVRSGKVMGNLMVDLNPSNSKLRDRAVRIVRELTGAEEGACRRALESTGWKVREACVRLGRPA